MASKAPRLEDVLRSRRNIHGTTLYAKIVNVLNRVHNHGVIKDTYPWEIQRSSAFLTNDTKSPLPPAHDHVKTPRCPRVPVLLPAGRWILNAYFEPAHRKKP